MEHLKTQKFENSTELIAYLNARNLVWKADKEEEKIYILDKSMARNKTREFAIVEDKDKKLFLQEM